MCDYDFVMLLKCLCSVYSGSACACMHVYMLWYEEFNCADFLSVLVCGWCISKFLIDILFFLMVISVWIVSMWLNLILYIYFDYDSSRYLECSYRVHYLVLIMSACVYICVVMQIIHVHTYYLFVVLWGFCGVYSHARLSHIIDLRRLSRARIHSTLKQKALTCAQSLYIETEEVPCTSALHLHPLMLLTHDWVLSSLSWSGYHVHAFTLHWNRRLSRARIHSTLKQKSALH